jgi:hypothetical protein
MSTHAPLPPAWVERILSRFGAIWGAQKVAAMFPAETHDEVRSVWAGNLGRFEPQTIAAALQAVTDSGREWPPSLSEFVKACQESAVSRRAHAPAALLDAPRAAPEVAAQHLAAVERQVASAKPRAGRDWAHRILARAAAGKSVPIAVRQAAERAVGAEAEVIE